MILGPLKKQFCVGVAMYKYSTLCFLHNIARICSFSFAGCPKKYRIMMIWFRKKFSRGLILLQPGCKVVFVFSNIMERCKAAAFYLVCRKVSTSRRSSHCSSRDITYSSHLFCNRVSHSICISISISFSFSSSISIVSAKI